MTSISHVFFDIGGVLGTNGWDREQRAAVRKQFDLSDEFEGRHGEVVAEWEIGRMTLDEYLDFVIFYCPRSFSRQEFIDAMLSQSQPFDGVIRLAALASKRRTLFTLNNESEALNVYRIEHFGLRSIFDGFLSSCWLGMRKPAPLVFERALGIAQVHAADALFIDDREQNLVPARRLGLHVHLFDGNPDRLAETLTSLGAL